MSKVVRQDGWSEIDARVPTGAGAGSVDVVHRTHWHQPLTGVLRGVSDGARTRDNRDHNPVLYQLSYTHHGAATEHTGPAHQAPLRLGE